MKSLLQGLLEELAKRIPYAQDALDSVAPHRSAEAVTRKNTASSYNRVYASDRLLTQYLNSDRLDFYHELADLVAPLEPRNLIDVGCGTGHLVRILIDRLALTPSVVVGIDHAEEGIARARLLCPTATWIVDDLYEWSGNELEFDLVLCVEVLEHLDDPAVVVRLLRQVCAPLGRIAITVPDGDQDSWTGHVNFWSETALGEFLAPHGLQRIDRVDHGRTLLAWLSPLS